MNNFETQSEEFTTLLSEAERCLRDIGELERELQAREAMLEERAAALTAELSAAGIDTPEALEQALTQLPDHQPAPLADSAQSQFKFKRQMGRMI